MKPTDLTSLTKIELLKLAKKLKLPADPKQLKKALVKSIQTKLKQPAASGGSNAGPAKSRAGRIGKASKAPRRKSAQTTSTPTRAPRAGSKPKSKKIRSSAEAGQESASSGRKKTGAKPAPGKRRARGETERKTKRGQSKAPSARRGRGRTAPAARPPVRLEEAPGGLEAKYLVASPRAQDEDKKHRPPQLPAGYGAPRVVLLARDPQWAFCYWEIPTGAAQEVLDRLGETWERVNWVLRLYSPDKGQAAQDAAFDVGVDPFAIGWYLHLSAPGASFQAELGLRDPKGRFAGLVCSNILTLPPDRPSDILDEDWRLTDVDIQTHYAAYPFSDQSRPGVTGPAPEVWPGSARSRPNPFDTR